MSTATIPSPTNLGASGSAGPRAGVVSRLVRDPLAVISFVVLVAITVLGLLAPLLVGNPNASSLTHVNAPVGTPGYLLGGDSSGRSILSLLVASINIAMLSAVIGAGIAVGLGTVAGLIAGYVGRRTNDISSWVFNLLMTFPAVVLLIVLFPVTGGSYPVTMAIYGVLMSPGIFVLVRNLVVGVGNELYVDAARVSGLSDFRILSRHIFYVVRGPIIVAAAFLAGACINLQAGLAFLGLGSAAVPSWGEMISLGFTNFYSAPLQFVWPSLALGITTTAFVLLGNAYRDALENQPRSRRRRMRRRSLAFADASRSGAAEGRTAASASSITATRTAKSAVGSSDGDVLRVAQLSVGYPGLNGGTTLVVDGIDLEIAKGEILGLVGESGSGKTQTAFAILGLLPPQASTSGTVIVDGIDVSSFGQAQFAPLRGTRLAYVPQEPMSNLDPSFTVGRQLAYGIVATQHLTKKAAKAQAIALLGRVGINDPDRVYRLYPHEISGGMAQRVLIAGAVASKPALLIADEPTTALDVTVQAEVLDLLRDLQSEMGMSILLVTHNFGVVADICDRVAVMNQGKIIETAATAEILRNPREAYTKTLLDSIPDGRVLRLPPLDGGNGNE